MTPCGITWMVSPCHKGRVESKFLSSRASNYFSRSYHLIGSHDMRYYKLHYLLWVASESLVSHYQLVRGPPQPRIPFAQQVSCFWCNNGESSLCKAIRCTFVNAKYSVQELLHSSAQKPFGWQKTSLRRLGGEDGSVIKPDSY